MTTINQSELRHLIDNLRESFRGGRWSDAIAALESRLFPPHRTVPWPDEPGLYNAVRGTEEMEVLAVVDVNTNNIRVGRTRDTEMLKKDDDWTFTGPLTVILPDKKPEPTVREEVENLFRREEIFASKPVIDAVAAWAESRAAKRGA